MPLFSVFLTTFVLSVFSAGSLTQNNLTLEKTRPLCFVLDLWMWRALHLSFDKKWENRRKYIKEVFELSHWNVFHSLSIPNTVVYSVYFSLLYIFGWFCTVLFFGIAYWKNRGGLEEISPQKRGLQNSVFYPKAKTWTLFLSCMILYG